MRPPFLLNQSLGLFKYSFVFFELFCIYFVTTLKMLAYFINYHIFAIEIN